MPGVVVPGVLNVDGAEPPIEPLAGVGESGIVGLTVGVALQQLEPAAPVTGVP